MSDRFNVKTFFFGLHSGKPIDDWFLLHIQLQNQKKTIKKRVYTLSQWAMIRDERNF